MQLLKCPSPPVGGALATVLEIADSKSFNPWKLLLIKIF
jgi:hypothetical protein